MVFNHLPCRFCNFINHLLFVLCIAVSLFLVINRRDFVRIETKMFHLCVFVWLRSQCSDLEKWKVRIDLPLRKTSVETLQCFYRWRALFLINLRRNSIFTLRETFTWITQILRVHVNIVTVIKSANVFPVRCMSLYSVQRVSLNVFHFVCDKRLTIRMNNSVILAIIVTSKHVVIQHEVYEMVCKALWDVHVMGELYK